MLEYLLLQNVGPADKMELALAPRMNLITGDNGLGKSFLLDVAWWALTRRWPQELNPRLTSGYPARPTDPKKPATIRFRLQSKTKPVAYQSTYVARDQAWQGRAGRPWNPGLVIYVHADGGFSVWDPARNYWKKRGNLDVQERLPGYVFSPKEVWDGLKHESEGKTTVVCNGLITDWAGWVRGGTQPVPDRAIRSPYPDVGPETTQALRTWATLGSILRQLVPPGETAELGPLRRLSVDDARDIPTIRTAYGEVPLLHASSGIRRAVALAYMLMWSWTEHHHAARLLGEPATDQVVVLFDEIESHLHPRWQRTILGALLNVVKLLHSDAKVQLIATTHSPLVMASAEPIFDPRQDAWFDLDLEGASVVLHTREFVRRGEVANWLTSQAFDLGEARSAEAEKALASAKALLRRSKPPTPAELQNADQELREARLPDIDPFWLRWSQLVKERAPARGATKARKSTR